MPLCTSHRKELSGEQLQSLSCRRIYLPRRRVKINIYFVMVGISLYLPGCPQSGQMVAKKTAMVFDSEEADGQDWLFAQDRSLAG
jgi:hypothetical protein